ncbi:MAG: hypothetical protein LBK76_12035 [Verrucomicrobiales bacterium]|jgi:RHS repeat-associated protein|nr:hypothetical protein [Verrucomicrobiales bacterium]
MSEPSSGADCTGSQGSENKKGVAMKRMMLGLVGVLAVTVSGWAKMPALVTDNDPGVPGQSQAYWDAVRAEQATQQARGGIQAVADSEMNFYTGKPYDADLGYLFKYRSYNPEIQRWTTMDLIGFPDGANNYCYAPIPVLGLDPLGLMGAKPQGVPGIPDFETASFSVTPKLTDYTPIVAANSDSGQALIDSYSSKWSATVSMSFDSPFDNGEVKVGEATYSITVAGNLSQGPYAGTGFTSSVPGYQTLLEGLVDSIVRWTLSLFSSSSPFGVNPTDLNKIVTEIVNNPPTIDMFASEFPGNKYPLFYE